VTREENFLVAFAGIGGKSANFLTCAFISGVDSSSHLIEVFLL